MDKIFGGQLVSTIVCEQCHNSSQMYEPFLDISLPLIEEKPQRPGKQNNKSFDEPDDEPVSCFGGFRKKKDGNDDNNEDGDSGKNKKMTKSEQKKAKAQARKVKKQNQRNTKNSKLSFDQGKAIAILSSQMLSQPSLSLFISMTSLFAHKVAQPTKWRLLPKNLSQLIIFVIGLAFTWV